MPRILSDDQVSDYRRDGFIHPVAALSAEDAAAYRLRFEAYEAEFDGWYEMSKGQKLYLLQTWIAELASHPRILDAVEDVLGPDIMVWGSSLFIKDAQTPSFVSWHQDSTYWGLSKPSVVTAWIALSPANRVSGCMKMMPGTHAWEQVAHTDTLAAENLLTRGQEISDALNEDEAVFMPLETGQASIHNYRLAHASGPNTSNDRRIGVSMHFMPPDSKQIVGDWDSAALVRGTDPYGHFEPTPVPAHDFDEVAVAFHAKASEGVRKVLYADAALNTAKL